jgi:bifunctional non-homologous end joining protein LigD
MKASSSLPPSENWTYEIKLDGLRALALKDDSQARLLPRNEKDFGSKFPEIIESIVDLNVKGRHHRRRNCGFA